MVRQQSGNLPVETSGLIGRRADLAKLKKALEGYRAVTVAGTGGVGKTRLACRIAAEVQNSFSDGAWLVELEDLTDGPLLPSTVLLQLGLRDDGTEPVLSRLIGHFRNRHALLVLDGCDPVVDACADLVNQLLAASPHLRVVVSSRRPLHIPAEAVVAVSALPLPPDDGLDPNSADLSRYDAVALFVERAAAVRPDLVFTGESLRTVARICCRLDGLPLAIEFAADRLDVLSLEELDVRLEDAYRVLVIAKRGAPRRQRTLQALVDSSYTMCSPEEQLLWARATVFTGRFSLPAAESVCADASLPEGQVLELIAGLIDKSILIREEFPGGTWYRLPRLLREYGARRLSDHGVQDDLRERHLRWALQLAEDAADGLLTAGSASWLGRINGNHANVRAALEFCFEDAGRIPDGLRLASRLWYYWLIAGLVAEGREWLDRGLSSATEPSTSRAQALIVAAHLELSGGSNGADAFLAEANVLERELGDPALTGNLRFVEGLRDLHRNDLAGACDRLSRALQCFRTTGQRMDRGKTLSLLGVAATLNGDPARGLQCCEEFLGMPEASTENWGFAYIQWTLALIRWQGGDLAGAVRAQQESARLVRYFDDRFGMATCVQSAALYLAAEGRHRDGALLAGAADSQRFPLFTALTNLRRERLRGLRAALGDDELAQLLQRGREMTLEEAVDLIAGPRPAVDPTVDATMPAELSKREWQVAELIAKGHGNKQIAAALVISIRTAEGHVQRILGKLGFTTRSQIAVWVTEHRAGAQHREVRHAR